MTEELKQLREALRRVKYEAAALADAQVIALEALTQRPAAQAGEREAWVPYLVDRADGVKGHYAIGRWNPRGYREVWNLHSHRWAAYSDDVMSLEEADSLLRQITIPTVRASLPTQPAAQAVTSAHITWDAEGRRMLNGRLAPEHATFSECDRVCWMADGMEAIGTVVRRHANDSDMVLVEIVSGRHWVHISRVHPMETKQATPEPVGEVVYQLQSGDGKWIDQTRASYDYNVKHGNTVRILHTRPAPGAPDVEAAAKKLAECMGYPWEHMPSAGRDNMRKHAEAVLAAAQAKGGE